MKIAQANVRLGVIVIRHLAVAALLGLTAAAGAQPAGRPSNATEALRTLAGSWTGDGLSLTFNPDTLQANDNPDKPFSWRSFRIVDVGGSWLIFDIGNERYFGLMKEPGAMTVTCSRFTGERRLQRMTR